MAGVREAFKTGLERLPDGHWKRGWTGFDSSARLEANRKTSILPTLCPTIANSKFTAAPAAFHRMSVHPPGIPCAEPGPNAVANRQPPCRFIPPIRAVPPRFPFSRPALWGVGRWHLAVGDGTVCVPPWLGAGGCRVAVFVGMEKVKVDSGRIITLWDWRPRILEKVKVRGEGEGRTCRLCLGERIRFWVLVGGFLGWGFRFLV